VTGRELSRGMALAEIEKPPQHEAGDGFEPELKSNES
jgi:hypothetical protein